MANDLNLCQFIGRLGKDPEIRYTQDGAAVANLSIACGSSWKDKATGEKQEKTEWVRIVAFGKLAEIIGEYLRKGQQVYVSGRIQTRKYEDRGGAEKYITEIIANNMQMLGSKPQSDAGAHDPSSPTKNSLPPRQDGKPSTADFDDDIPF